ncbi:MAG: cache domain-containing protein [Acidobacteria bacterium]|nr:cache domain-containing protein [Acidobacteriota bacterium]
MAPRFSHPHINYRVLTVLMLVALPLLAIGGLVALGVGQAQLRETSGLHLEQLAERTAAAVDAYVFRRVIDVSLLARIPQVRETAAAGSREPLDAERIRQIDQQWQREQKPPPAAAGLLENATSRFFRDLAERDQIYSELLLTDREGRLVAASDVATDYFQADEDWWRQAFNTRRTSVSDVRWDESTRTYAIEISVPVLAAGSDEVMGVLKAATNSREMLAAVSGLQLGGTGEAVLVRKDGSLVYSRRGVQAGTQFFAADLLRESLGLAGAPAEQRTRAATDRAGDPQFRVHFSARTADRGRALVAVAPTQLGMSYSDLQWLVAVYQAEDELFAPVRAQMWYFLLLLATVAVAVLAFALWFSMRLAAPPFEIDMELVKHAKVHRIDEEEEQGEELPQPTLPG